MISITGCTVKSVGSETMLPPVLRLALALAGGLTMLFTGTVAFTRAHAQPDDRVRDFLKSGSAGCMSDVPCFLGIQPGETHASDAFTLLESHEWVDERYLYRGMEIDSGLVQWTWSGAQPEYIDDTRRASLWFQDAIVRWVEIDLNLSFGDIWLLLDAPQTGRIHMVSSTPARAYQLVDYLKGGLQVRTEFLCPLHLMAFWRATVQVTANSPVAPRTRADPSVYRLPHPHECA
jgi:hypothetical protein